MIENNFTSKTVIEIDLTYIMSEVEEIVKNYNLTEINQLSVDLEKRILSEK